MGDFNHCGKRKIKAKYLNFGDLNGNLIDLQDKDD
jgi:hypothetical protein